MFLVCIAFSLVAEENASSFSIIKGSIKSKSGEPLDYVSVHARNTRHTSLSDEKGNFLLKLPEGNRELIFSSLGYQTKIVEISARGGEKHTLSVVLEESSQLLSEVEVRGKSEGRQLKEGGLAVSVVDTKKASLQSVQALELLDKTAGVRILQSGGLGSEVQYNINGLTGSSVRIFIDGIPIRNYGSSFSLSSIPPAQIERIEVYKGVVPAHLSEDALGGAVNVVLKKTKRRRNRLSASYSYGSFNTHRGNIDGSYRNDEIGLMVEASAFYNYTDNNYKVWGEKVYIANQSTNWHPEYITAERFHDSYESYGVNGNVGFTDVKWADRMTVGFLFSDMNKDVQHGATMETPFANRRTGQNTKMLNLKYEKRNLFTKGLSFNSFISYTHGNRWVVDTIPYKYNWLGEKNWIDDVQGGGRYAEWATGAEQSKQPTLAQNKERTIAGRANLSYKFHPQHSISANYLYNGFIRDVEDPLLPRAEQELTDTRYLTKQIFGFTYSNVFFNERLKTSLFFKHYIQSVKLKDPVKTNNVLSAVEYDKDVNHSGYGVMTSFAIFPKILLQASYEKALRMPGDNELLGNTSESADANYELKPERSNNVNVGTILGPFDIHHHQLRGDINFFIRDIYDMITRGEEKSNTLTYAYENLGRVSSKGFDTEIGYSYKNKFFTMLNMSLFNARFNLEYYTDDYGNKKKYSYYGDRLRNAPYLTINASAEYVLSDFLMKGSRMTFSYNYGYVHQFFVKWESHARKGKDMVPSQNIHDLGIAYTFPKRKLTLSFNAKNIFNEQIFDNWALQKPGRAFYGKLTFNIL